MNRAPRRGLTALVLVSAVSACSNDPTEIVVVVHSDLAVPSAIDSLRIDVLEPDGETKSSTLALASAASLPGRLGVTHGSGALYPVEIVATGLAAGRPIVTQRARVGFVPNRSRLLELFLLDACRDVSCDAETTCEGGVCLSIERGTLPPWRGRVPGFDAGAAFDAAPHDGSTDAGTDAPRDGGPDDASVDPCDEPRRLPPRPSIEDTPGGEPPRFYAMRALDYGTPLRLEPGCPYEPNPVARPRTIFELGYDIDGARTAHGTTVECSPFDPMRGPGNDGCGGVDNVLGALYGLIATGFGCSLAELGDHIESGRGGFLLWVRGWNGAPDDRRVEVALLPTMLALRDRMQERHAYATPPRVGAAGGIATPAAAAAAFSMGAGWILCGSVNQACVESGSSDAVREMLAAAEQADVAMAPAADMFEMGVKVQVLKRGTMFPMRAQRLHDLWRAHGSLESLPAAERESLERTVFRAPLEEVWRGTREWFLARDPSQVERAEREPAHRMALVFRWYLGMSSRWANAGEPTRRLDYQVWCGPAMGAFNEWTKGTFLAEPRNRRVAVVAANLVRGAAVLLRAGMLRAQGIDLPPGEPRAVPVDGDVLARDGFREVLRA
ncbi:MAG: hypothetical protein HUU06_08505 [Planctomycetaceae bacterium]|nr:hypothetical protein [Planctomycetaceae bacterium]